MQRPLNTEQKKIVTSFFLAFFGRFQLKRLQLFHHSNAFAWKIVHQFTAQIIIKLKCVVSFCHCFELCSSSWKQLLHIAQLKQMWWVNICILEIKGIKRKVFTLSHLSAQNTHTTNTTNNLLRFIVLWSMKFDRSSEDLRLLSFHFHFVESQEIYGGVVHTIWTRALYLRAVNKRKVDSLVEAQTGQSMMMA